MEGVSTDTASNRQQKRRLLENRHDMFSTCSSTRDTEINNVSQLFHSKRPKPHPDSIKHPTNLITAIPPVSFLPYENTTPRVSSHSVSGARMALPESLQTTQFADTGLSQDVTSCCVRPVARRVFPSNTMGAHPTVFSDPSKFGVTKQISSNHDTEMDSRIRKYGGRMTLANEIPQSRIPGRLSRFPVLLSTESGTIMHSVPSHSYESDIDEDITYSQDMLHDLSVQEAQALVYLELDQEFLKALNETEVDKMVELNLITIPLADVSDPVFIGRDSFKVVFGDQIHKSSTSLLSRKHCLFHVCKTGGNGPSGYSVSVENTSTNGIDVNGEPIPRGSTQLLACGDVVTLLRLSQCQAISNLAIRYTLRDESSPDLNRNPHIGRFLVDEISVSSDHHGHLSIAEEKLPLQNVSLMKQTASKEEVFRCSVMLAHSILTDMDDSKSRDYRDELHLMFSPILSHGYIQLDFQTATKVALEKAVKTIDLVLMAEVKSSFDRPGITLVNGDGLPETLDMPMLREVCQVAPPSKLIILFSEEFSCAKCLSECGIPHVIYVTSSSKYKGHAAFFIRILIGGLLHEFSIKTCFENARNMAFGDIIAENHTSFDEVQLLSTPIDHTSIHSKAKRSNCKWETIVKHNFVSLSSFVIPNPPEFFIDRNQEITEIVKFIRSSPARICNLHGAKGIGKSTIAIHVTKYVSQMQCFSPNIQYISLGDYERNILTEQDAADTEATYDFNVALLHQLHLDIDELHTAVTIDDSRSSLLIFDGCDFHVEAPMCDFLSRILSQFPSFKIITTSRKKLAISMKKPASIEYLEIHPLPDQSAAKLLIAYCEEPIALDKLKQSSADWQSDDLVTVIKSHPAVKQLRGNPSLLRKLAREMKTNALDELICKTGCTSAH
uniref:Uncharacterized protein AlNc14C363G11020 n=1 Tax=Albugo laibachii Nc14 TaxID=890382 RepID=F0WXT3_9STRA|nr:conserved hypothetical protein [Albugo laibachii Nc14]|eukprot:CCA26281.1 conserved hypothetical protein [Albugo laibachii Nc14]